MCLLYKTSFIQIQIGTKSTKDTDIINGRSKFSLTNYASQQKRSLRDE